MGNIERVREWLDSKPISRHASACGVRAHYIAYGIKAQGLCNCGLNDTREAAEAAEQDIAELQAFIRSEGASATFIRWRATRDQAPLTNAMFDKLVDVRKSLREPMAVPKPPADTKKED